MIECEVLVSAAILTSETVAQENVESCECGRSGRFNIGLERYNARQPEFKGRAADDAVILRDNVHPIKEHRFYRVLPAPK